MQIFPGFIGLFDLKLKLSIKGSASAQKSSYTDLITSCYLLITFNRLFKLAPNKLKTEKIGAHYIVKSQFSCCIKGIYFWCISVKKNDKQMIFNTVATHYSDTPNCDK